MNIKNKLTLFFILFLSILLIVGSFNISAFPIEKDKQERSVNPKPWLEINGLKLGWPGLFDGGDEDGPMAGMVLDSEENIVVSGYSFRKNTGKSDFLTIKYDHNGNELWHAFFDRGIHEIGWDIAVDSEDNIIIFGVNFTKLNDFSNLLLDFIVVKYNKDGEEIWNITFDKGLNGYPGGVVIDSQDNIIINGGFGDFNAMNFSCFTTKIDKNGEIIWDITFREDMANLGCDITVDEQDNIISCGIYGSFFGQGIFLLKYDSTGNKKWITRHGGTEPTEMTLDNEKNIIITGRTMSSSTSSVSFHTIKCDSSGNKLWEKVFNSGTHDSAYEVATDSNNNIIVVGYSQFGNESYEEHCTIIYDINGEEQCIKRSGLLGILYGVKVNSDDEIIVTGGYVRDDVSYDYITTKYADVTPPSINSYKPEKGNLYIFDMINIPIPNNIIIFGKITIELSVIDINDVSKIELYIDYKLKEELTNNPFKMVWDDFLFGQYKIRFMVYDHNGNIKKIDLNVIKIL